MVTKQEIDSCKSAEDLYRLALELLKERDQERERCAEIARDACYCGGTAGCEGCWAEGKIREGKRAPA